MIVQQFDNNYKYYIVTEMRKRFINQFNFINLIVHVILAKNGIITALSILSIILELIF